MKQELSSCKEELKASAVREHKLLERISALKKNEPCTVNTNSSNKDDFYVVGWSLLREINDNDLVTLSNVSEVAKKLMLKKIVNHCRLLQKR